MGSAREAILRLKIENNMTLSALREELLHCVELAGMNPVMIPKKSPMKIKRKDSTSGAAEKILYQGLNEIIDAYDYLLTHLDDPEGVHQTRVKIRKFRGILAFFAPLFEADKYRQQQEKLRKTGLEFGVIRQVDVVLEEIAEIERTSLISVSEFCHLKNKLNKKREEALHDLVDYADHNDFIAVVLDIWLWLLNRPWEKSTLLDLTIDKYSEKYLDLWLKRINKSIKKMNMENKEDIHKVRIKSKKLRYVMEQLLPILDKDMQKSIKKFEKLQDDLGYFHDVYVNKEFLEDLIPESDEKQLYYEAGIFIGWQKLQGYMKMSKYL